MKEREKFASRLGFILISAGCAIGLGNVWRFPYITGQYGGAAFVLVYLLFLLILGLPIMVMEFADRPCQPEVGGALVPRTGTQRLQVALVQLWRDDWQLYADGVLHHGRRLDARLLHQDGGRRVRGPEPRAGRRRVQ